MTDQMFTRLPETPALSNVRAYLERTGWERTNEDARTSLWRFAGADDERLAVVLPASESFVDASERLKDALRTIAFAEQRSIPEIVTDMAFLGGADTLSVRLTPEGAPSGSAPLVLLQAAIVALRDFVVGSASALEVEGLVLPPRRPARAENYAAQTLASTAPGSFVVNLALPLLETAEYAESPRSNQEGAQPALLDIFPQPYGRRVAHRMREIAERSVALAEEVGAGNRPLRAFAESEHRAANATELAALAALGGAQGGRYQMRFTQAPSHAERVAPMRLAVTPAQQSVLANAAEFLRTRQPRAGVTVSGLVVRLARIGNFGPGEVVVQGESDDSGAQRRYRMELGEDDYNEAVRAHREGLQVLATGDFDFAGTRASLRRLTGFAVIPGID
jgi:hypothetical protein